VSAIEFIAADLITAGFDGVDEIQVLIGGYSKTE